MAPRPHHRSSKTLTRRLQIAARWIDLSDALALLAPAERGQKPGAGRPVELAQFSARSLLIVMAEIVLARRTISYTEITTTIWVYYSKQILASLGLEGIRDAKTHSELLQAARPDATAADLHRGRLAEERARRRIIDAFEQATAPINDNVAPANKRHTHRQLNEARANNDVSVQRAARLDVFNKIIQGSLYAANEWAHTRPDAAIPVDPKDLLGGILKGWFGDLAIDETDADHSIATLGRGNDLTSPDAYHPISELAEFFFKDGSRLRWPNALGLTFAIAVSRPEERRVPTVALGASIDNPSAASYDGAMTALDAIDNAGLRPRTSSNAHQYVAVDQAYPHRTAWADGIAERNYSQVIRYPKNAARVHGLRACGIENTKVAAHLFNGVPICPGVSSAALRRTVIDAPRREDSRGDFLKWGQRLHRHQEHLDRILPFVMIRHGRPSRTPDNGPGRPRAGVPAKPDVYRMRVMCPAVAGTARCPLVPASMEADPDLPIVPDPPIEDDRPATCRNSLTRLQLTHQQFRRYQPRMLGDYLHEDFYTSARARNEGFHAALLHGSTGHLARGRIQPWKNAFLTIALALAVGATNIHIVERWVEVVTLNGGKAPYETHRKNQRIRANAIAAYLAHRRNQRTH